MESCVTIREERISAEEYIDFLKNKIQRAPVSGFDIDLAQLHPALKPHQRDAVAWALHSSQCVCWQSVTSCSSRTV